MYVQKAEGQDVLYHTAATNMTFLTQSVPRIEWRIKLQLKE